MAVENLLVGWFFCKLLGQVCLQIFFVGLYPLALTRSSFALAAGDDFLRLQSCFSAAVLAAVMEVIKETIAVDPYASRFALSGPLRRYGRLKGMGLPNRYRLFFRPFEAEGRRLLLILWLGSPCKEGDRNDSYAVFSRLVRRGELPEDWASLQSELAASEPTFRAVSTDADLHPWR
jgi:hypothetical protein